MNLKDLENFSNNASGKVLFDYNLNKTNWFNIGGKTKVFLSQKN